MLSVLCRFMYMYVLMNLITCMAPGLQYSCAGTQLITHGDYFNAFLLQYLQYNFQVLQMLQAMHCLLLVFLCNWFSREHLYEGDQHNAILNVPF